MITVGEHSKEKTFLVHYIALNQSTRSPQIKLIKIKYFESPQLPIWTMIVLANEILVSIWLAGSKDEVIAFVFMLISLWQKGLSESYITYVKRSFVEALDEELSVIGSIRWRPKL